MKKALWIFILLFTIGIGTLWAKGKPTVKEDTLGQSKIMIAEPEKWNGRVLILAHGLRIEKEPLSADFDAEILPYKQLLKEGWLIASTSYRRNGFIVDDAILDIDSLRDYVIKTYGQPKQIYLLGWSMGGNHYHENG